jgi:hypothetical protein
VFVDQFIPLASKDEAEVVKTLDDPFKLTAGGQLYDNMAPIPPNPVKKLILNIDLILHHRHLPSLPKDF